MKRIFAIAILASALATPASALNSSFEAQSMQGTHQFYVWCTGRADSTATQAGANAKAAQVALARRSGANCWPVWQGLQN